MLKVEMNKPTTQPEWEFITPSKAADLLNHNNSNRRLTPGTAEKYEHDMRDGAWTECLVPIVIYDDGEVGDGQHRLWAIVNSGEGQWFLVARGVSRAVGLNFDTGKPRSIVDNARISGTDPELSHRLIAACRGIADGDSGGRVRSSTELLAVIAEHRAAATWAMEHGPRGRGINNAISLAAIARAYYVEADHERLARYGVVLGTGFSDGDDEKAAIAMRNYLTDQVARGVDVTRSAHWRDTFLRFQNTIFSFMRQKPLTIVKTVTDERYPLPQSRSVSTPRRSRAYRSRSNHTRATRPEKGT